MANEIYTAEQEGKVFEEILRDLGIELNNNYFRAEKGFHPFIHRILSSSRIIKGYFMKSYFLVFTSDQLILMYRDNSKSSIDDNIVKMDYEDIQNFDVTQNFAYYCLQFKYDDKQFYFHIDADGVFSLTERNYSDENFHALKDKDFMGLL